MQLSKNDQSTIDRLSDVAGPLRPRERFEPYLTGYPLPSGMHYVLARTWQDLTVNRAGCVRTISLIIPTADWAAAQSLLPFLDLLDFDRLPEDMDATGVTLQPTSLKVLPPTTDFNGNELLEALFLEDQRPVVVFDAVSPEFVAMRLLTSLWPSMRRHFAMSTFALSPRKVGGRDFNLVFAPKDARSKFSDWNGRRIDGRSSPDVRHRWTKTISSRVFEAPHPRLLSSGEEGLVVEEADTSDHVAALRIALLWDELLTKLETMPTAALGLLDIANSGKVRGSVALEVLEPSLVDAIRRAPSALPQDEAWNFLSAIARKMHGRSISRGTVEVGLAVAELARRAPEGAMTLLSHPDDQGVVKRLAPIIADVIGDSFNDRAEQALFSAPPEVLGSLVAESARLAEKVANNRLLIDRFGDILPHFDTSLAAAVSRELLPHLVLDWQLPAARPLLKNLDGEQLGVEVQHLGSVNDFAATNIADLCLRHASEIGAKRPVLSALASLSGSKRRDGLLAHALDPSVEDVVWLLRNSGLSSADSAKLFAGLMKRADDRQLEAILADSEIGEYAITVAELTAPDLLSRIIFIDTISLEMFVRVVGNVFIGANAYDKASISKRALQRCFGQHFDGDEIAFISKMLGGLGEQLDSRWVARLGFSHEVHASIASRNMVAIHNAPCSTRVQFVSSIDAVAQFLHDRRYFDLNEAAAGAFANLLLDAERIAPHAALYAAGLLLPMLMQQRKDPVSLIIVAAFPLLYKELAKKDDVPDLLKFVPFLTWDRCKAARQELVSAFMSSSWAPSHLALTACRCSDVSRILRKTAKAYDGEAYLNSIAADLSNVPNECRQSIEKTITSIRSDWASKYDWSD